MGEKAPFRTTIHGNKNFSPDKIAYGLDKPMLPKKAPKEP